MALKKWFKNKKKNTKRNKLSISKTRKFNKKRSKQIKLSKKAVRRAFKNRSKLINVKQDQEKATKSYYKQTVTYSQQK